MPRPDADLRSAASRRLALEKKQELKAEDNDSGDEDNGGGRLAAVKAAIDKRRRKRQAAQQSREKAAKLKAKRDGEDVDAATARQSLTDRILGEDTAEEVARFVDAVGPQPTDKQFDDALGIDFDGDGDTLGEELGFGAGSQRLDDDLQALNRGRVGQSSRESQLYRAGERQRDGQLEDDLRALGMAGQEDRNGR